MLRIRCFLTDELMQRASNFNMSQSERSLIEAVDLVGSAQDISLLAREKIGNDKCYYIISSHNFEHISVPVKFLIG